MHTQESIALAAGLLGQAKGDIAAARRAAGEAHAWLCSIDSSYKGEAKPVPVSDETRQRLEQQVRVLTEAKASAEQSLTAASRRVQELEAELAKLKAKPAPAPAPVPVAKPAPIQLPTPKVVDLSGTADPFAHLPPAMREFARQAAAGKLEID